MFLIFNSTFSLVANWLLTTIVILYFLHNIAYYRTPLQQKVKGIGKLGSGLYKLILPGSCSIPSISSNVFTPSSSSFNCKDNLHLWHLRLGHVPLSSLRHISSLNTYVSTFSNQSFHCDVCHFARQTRQPFPLSSSYSPNLFDLIHCDLWGPYKHPTYDRYNSFLTIVEDPSRAT